LRHGDARGKLGDAIAPGAAAWEFVMRVGFRHLVLAVGVAALLWTGGASADDQYQIDPAIAVRLRAIGRAVNIPAAAAIYAPLQVKAPKDGVKHTDNLAYGRDPAQRLDVYEPTVRTIDPLPVLIFIHGGGFTHGDKSPPGSPFYANVGYWFARHGVITVLADYRLAPKYKWPTQAKDMAGIVAWTHAHIAEYGGSPKRIFLMGQAAGASDVAAYALERRFQPLAGPGIEAAIFYSGLYDPAFEAKAAPRFGMVGPGGPNEAYYGKKLRLYAMRSTMEHITAPPLPILIIDNELDPPLVQVEAGMMFGALCRRDPECPRLLWVPYHVAGSAMFTINTDDHWLADRLMDFIRSPAE
jgi:acetyl esterase/lipase